MHSMLLLAAVDSSDQIASILEPPTDEGLHFETHLLIEWFSAKIEGCEKHREIEMELEWYRQGSKPEASEPLPIRW